LIGVANCLALERSRSARLSDHLLAIPWMYGSGPLPTLGEILDTAVVMALMGAGSAAGSLALARRADPVLESGEEVGLLEEETSDAGRSA
jgi:hypothetical protein